MKRGLPKGGAQAPQGRDARARRAVKAGATATLRRSSAAAPWWHQPVLWLVMMATLPLINARTPEKWPPSLAFARAAVVDHVLPPAGPAAASERTELRAGSAALWLPFFLAANAGVHLAQGRGSVIPADGFSWPFAWASAAGTAFYAFLGLWLSYRIALRFAQPSAALVATITVWLASSLPVYLYAAPFSSHALSMFSAALMLTLWFGVRDGKDSRWRWLVWGTSGGLAIATSLVNAAFLVIAVIEILMRVRRGVVDALIAGATFLAGVVAVLGPALLFERQIDGGWLIDGHSPVLRWSLPHLVATAFSTDHGLFLWTPVALFGAAGLLLAIRRQPSAGATLAIASAALFCLAAAQDAPRQAISFGAPLLLALTPVFIPGLAALVDAVAGSRGRGAWAGVMVVAATLILWNFGLMLQWRTGLIPNNGPIDFRQAAINQVTVVPHVFTEFVIRYSNERRGLVSASGGAARE